MFEHFLRAEHGGAFVDWKVITFAVGGLGIAVGTYAFSGSETVSKDVQAVLQDESLPDKIFPGRTVD